METKLLKIAFMITERCTLKCKLCATFCTGKVGEIYDMSFKEFKYAIDKVFNCVEEIDELGFTGGEALLNKELPDFLHYSLKYKNRMKRLSLISNGTIIPSDKIITLLKNDWSDILTFHISDYGALSNKINELINVLTVNNISYRRLNFIGDDQHSGGWVDFTDHTQKFFEEDEVIENAKFCRVKISNHVVINKYGLFNCSRLSERIQLGIVPDDKTEYIDIFSEEFSPLQFKERLEAICAKKYYSSCKFCFGLNPSAKRYPAAEQI